MLDEKEPPTLAAEKPVARRVLVLLIELRNIYQECRRRERQSLADRELIDRRIISFIAEARGLLDIIPAGGLPEFAPDWNESSNLGLLLKAQARNLATLPRISGLAAIALNEFGNSQPLMFRNGDFQYSFDFHSSRIPVLHQLLRSFQASQPAQRWLLVSPETGVIASWLVDNYIAPNGGKVDCVQVPSLLKPERALLDLNLAERERFKSVDMFVEQRAHAFAGSIADTVYDVIFVEGRRRLNDQKRSAYSDLATLTALWRILRKGGLLIVDDQLQRQNPVAPYVWTLPHVTGFDCLLPAIQDEFRTLHHGNLVGIQKLRHHEG